MGLFGHMMEKQDGTIKISWLKIFQKYWTSANYKNHKEGLPKSLFWIGLKAWLKHNQCYRHSNLMV